MSKRQADSQKRFAFASQLEFADSSIPKEIQVIPCGEWNHPYYGPMKITASDIAELKRNFDEGVRNDLPITAGHDNGMSGGELEAVAWYDQVIDRGSQGLFATVKWNPEGERLLNEHAFKYFSTEFYATYTDPQSGRVYNNVLCGGALTNRPYFKEMEPVGQFSENGIMSNDFNDNEPIPMELKDIVVIKASDLNDEQKTFLIAHKSELSAEQAVTFKEIVGETTVVAPVQVAKTEETKVVTMSEKDVNDLRAKAQQGVEAMARIEASDRAAVVASLMFSETNTVGRFSVAQKSAVEAFVLTLSEAQRAQFTELVKGIPANSEQMFKELGDGGAAAEKTAAGLAAQMKVLAEAKVTASEGTKKPLSYAQAIKQVYTDKPELKAAYDAALAAEQN